MNGLTCFPSSYLRYEDQKKSCVRIQLDASCTVQHGAAPGKRETFHLIAPCRAELMYLKNQVFYLPNYEFSGIWSDEEHLILRRHWVTSRKNRQYGRNPDLFRKVSFQITTFRECRLLERPADVAAAVHQDAALVGRTEIRDGSAGVGMVLEYPIKTLNARLEDDCFQVDTGPVPFADFKREEKSVLERMRLAYLGFNSFDRAELIFRTTFPIRREDGTECHKTTDYSEVRKVEARNSVFICR